MSITVSVETAGSGVPLLPHEPVTTLEDLQDAALAKMQEIAPVEGEHVCRLLRYTDAGVQTVDDVQDLNDGDELHALRTSLAGDFGPKSCRFSTITGKWAVFSRTNNRMYIKDLTKPSDLVMTKHSAGYQQFYSGMHLTMGLLVGCGTRLWQVQADGTLQCVGDVVPEVQVCLLYVHAAGDSVWCRGQTYIHRHVFGDGKYVKTCDYAFVPGRKFWHFITCWGEGDQLRVLWREGKKLQIVAQDMTVCKEAMLPQKMTYIAPTLVLHEQRCVVVAPCNATFFEVRDLHTLERVGVRLRKGNRSHIRRAAVDDTRKWLVAFVWFGKRDKPVIVAWELATGQKYVQCRLTELLDNVNMQLPDMRYISTTSCQFGLAFIKGCSTIAMTVKRRGRETLLEKQVLWTGDKVVKEKLPPFRMRLRPVVVDDRRKRKRGQ